MYFNLDVGAGWGRGHEVNRASNSGHCGVNTCPASCVYVLSQHVSILSSDSMISF